MNSRNLMGVFATMVNLCAFEAAADSVGGEAAEPQKAKAAPEKVTMSDSRVVEFVGKRKLLKESFLKDDGSVDFIRLDFRNGETRRFVIPEALLGRFAAHGAEQKLGDEVAGTEDVDDMVLEIDDLISRLEKGEWNVKREGGGMAGTSVLIKALMQHANRTLEQVQTFLKGKTPAEKMALRNSPKIKPIVEQLEAEKLAKSAKVDTDALLGQL